MSLSEKKVLLGWELGLGFGHVRRLAVIAERLIEHGYSPVFALRHPDLLDLALPGHSYTVRQAPWSQPLARPHPERPLSGFADIMATFGFGEAPVLASLVEAWDTLLREVQPALVVCDYSPTLCLAAAGAVPVVVIGDGFTLPPPDQIRFPVLQGRTSGCVSEETMLDHIATVQHRRRMPVPPTLPTLLAGNAHFVCTLPELDPYRAGRSRPADGPLLPLAMPTAPPAAPRIFAYLGVEFPVAFAAMDAIASLGLPAAAYVRGATPEQVARFQASGVQCHAEPPDLRAELATSSLIVHHGGIATTETALCMGRPQMILWHHLEQCLNARSIYMMQCGPHVSAGARSPEALAGLLKGTLQQPLLTRRAREHAVAIAARGQEHCLDRLTAACIALLR